MEKRYVTFIVISLVLVISHQLIISTFFPPKKKNGVANVDGEQPGDGEPGDGEPGEGQAQPGDGKQPGEEVGAEPPTATDPQAENNKPKQPNDPDADPKDPNPKDPPNAAPAIPTQWAVLGNYGSGLHLAYLSNHGAAVRRVELVERKANGKLRYRDLVNKSGYLGFLALKADANGGCKINVVGPGTPADSAGLKPGDAILRVNDTDLTLPSDLGHALQGTKPTQEIPLEIRGSDGKARSVSAKLGERPLAIIHGEVDLDGESLSHPGSFLMSLYSIRGDGQGIVRAKGGSDEIAKIRSMRTGNWKLRKVDNETIEFTWDYSASDLNVVGVAGALKIVKTFSLAAAPANALDYHLDLDVAIHNVGPNPLQVAYRLDGPNGLPTEGWWYLYKVHPDWGTCGARDIVWQTSANYELRSVNQIWKRTSNKKAPEEPAFVTGDAPNKRAVQFVGVDTQYFNVAIAPKGDAENGLGVRPFQELTPFLLNPRNTINKKNLRLGNVSFRMISEASLLNPNASLSHEFAVFAGPKRSEILARYGMDETIVWGWFWWVAWPLSMLLHFFVSIVGNYGLAILFMTIMVRACVHPISRKAHNNTAMMQALQPEIKKLTERYKDDPQKKMAAQQELYKKHNFNPLSGCLLAFAQFPIFIGLYRCLSVDIELRDAALIPGVNWCTNLAGPDMLYEWGPQAWPFLTAYTGWLGPNLNVLPLVSVVLFIVQQQMFTPPATDDQQAMQHNMMKMMTFVIGILFYKVAAGLCLYIIISSLWGVLERQLMPKKTLAEQKSANEKPPAPVEKPKRTAEDIKKAENAAKRKKRKSSKGK